MHSGRFLSYLKKRKFCQNDYSMSFVVNCCHLLSPIAIRCHSLYHSFYHSLLFIVTCCHSFSFDVSLVCLFINDRKNQGQGTNQSQFMTIGIQNKKLVIKKPTTQKMKFCIKDFFSKVKQIHKKMWISSHLLKNI